MRSRGAFHANKSGNDGGRVYPSMVRAVDVSSLDIISRITNFCTLPVTVIGNSSTNRT